MTLIGTFLIMIILIAVLGLVVVNAMKHSPWATSTVAATIPIAMIVGFYMRNFSSRPRVGGLCFRGDFVTTGGCGWWLDRS